MKRVFILGLLAASMLAAAPAKKQQAKKHSARVPGVVNAATYPVRHPLKVLKVGGRILW
jgi:hypothetical protein